MWHFRPEFKFYDFRKEELRKGGANNTYSSAIAG